MGGGPGRSPRHLPRARRTSWLTTQPFTAWDWNERPKSEFVGVGGGWDFDHPPLNADVQAQHERLHQNNVDHGISFPKSTTKESLNHPVRLWAGGSSPDITRYWLATPQERLTDHKQETRIIAHRLDAHLNNGPSLPEHVHVYSAISPKFGEHLASKKLGEVYHNPSPISTSLSPGVAVARTVQHFIHLSLPKGSKAGLYIANAGHAFQHEAEFTLKRDLPLKLVGHTAFDLGPNWGTSRHKGMVFHFEHSPSASSIKW